MFQKKEKKNFLKFVTPFFAHGHIYLSKLVSTYRRRQSSVATPLPVRGQSCLVRIRLRGNNTFCIALRKMLLHKKKQKNGHEVCQPLSHLGGAGGKRRMSGRYMTTYKNEWMVQSKSKKNLIQKRCPRINAHFARMRRNLRFLVWALTLQILPLHAQEEDHSNDDIQDPNAPISLVRPFSLSWIFFFPSCSLHCRSEPLLPQTDSFPLSLTPTSLSLRSYQIPRSCLLLLSRPWSSPHPFLTT